ncbi:hypothetical protein GCK32_010266 [Trichostrongylus colubriformis]|uniref:FAM86 N-terminal domain-containing protein n=1 Tax=Trichostrongylus colubriformis TaxID=6319 RepID=A0AAN8FVQ1_TRICO
MAYPTPDLPMSSLKQRIMSTSPISSSQKLLESHVADRNSGIDAFDFALEAVTFTRYYFASTKIPMHLLTDVVELFSLDDQFYDKFVKSVLCNEILEKYPTRKSYRRNLLKSLIDQLERRNMDVPDELYTACADCMLDTMESCFRIFLTYDLMRILVVIRESTQQLCYGTTGLSLWQASCDLANFLCSFVDLSNAKVLELGAGCGLTGIAVARSFRNSAVSLSDYDPKVLMQLEFNVQENFCEACSSMEVLSIDWTSFDITQLPSVPDIVIAADVVYDPKILPALCSVLRSCLQTSQKSRAYVASTLRDPITMTTFRANIDSHGLRVSDEMQYHYGAFKFLDGSKYEYAPSFPHSSTLDAPTLIFEIVAYDLQS